MEKMGFISTTNLENSKILNFISAIIIPNTGKKSRAGYQAVRDKYNWLHTNDLLLCAKIQGFWSYV